VNEQTSTDRRCRLRALAASRSMLWNVDTTGRHIRDLDAEQVFDAMPGVLDELDQAEAGLRREANMCERFQRGAVYWESRAHRAESDAAGLAAALQTARAERDAARSAIQRVRNRHRPFSSTARFCRECATGYPCPTVRALDWDDLR
jgi:hypothetical protein